jgi:mono/diheme cytochrome c family protein
MLKVLVAALVGTVIGIVVMVAVIAISGTDTSDASSVGLGSLSLSTYTPSETATSTPPPSSGGGSTPTSGGGSTPTSGGGASGDATKGEALFTEKTCSSCHADQAGAASPFSGAPNLADLNASGSLDEQKILDQIANGGGPMPAGLASGQDAQDIAAYILSLGQ